MKTLARFLTIGSLVILVCLVGLLANQLRLKETGIAEACTSNVSLQTELAGLEKDYASALDEIQELKQELAISYSDKLRNFKSLEELQAFLAEDKTDELEYTIHEFDCEDFSITLTQNAMDDGYWIHSTLWWGNVHRMNTAWVECEDGIVESYLIEPNNDRIMLLGTTDKIPEGIEHTFPSDVVWAKNTKYAKNKFAILD